jgi:hypothetical protein
MVISRPKIRRKLALALLSGAVLAAGAAGASPAQALVPYHGVNVSGIEGGTTDPSPIYAQLAAAHRLHANVIRIEFAWRALEQTPGQLDPGQLGLADQVMKRAHQLGLKVILTLDHTPCWASAAPPADHPTCNSTSSDPLAPDYPPADPQVFARFAGQMAARYKADLLAIEIWNEPDHQDQLYFAGPNKPQRYAAMLRAAYKAIKQADQHIQVLGGSLVGANGAFLEALYAQGIKGFYDGLSIHYYDVVLGSVRNIRSVQVHHGDHKPLWLIEFGWTTCLPRSTQGGHDCVSPRVQAQDLSDIFAATAHTGYLKAATIYNMLDDTGYDFGLENMSSQPKLAFSKVSQIFASGRARLSPVTVHLRRQGGHVVASGTVPAGDAAELDVNIGPSLRYKATFTPDRYNHYSLSIPASLGTRGMHIHVYQYWSGKGAWAWS